MRLSAAVQLLPGLVFGQVRAVRQLDARVRNGD